MNKKLHPWLIRLYALIILVVLFGQFLEGAAYTIVIGLASVAIIVQSFLWREK